MADQPEDPLTGLQIVAIAVGAVALVLAAYLVAFIGALWLMGLL